MENYLTFRSQSTGSRSKSSIYVEIETETCHLIHGHCLGHRERFGQSTSRVRFITDALLIKEFFTQRIKASQVETQCREVQGAHDTVLDYGDLFSVTFRDDNVQEFDARWDEILLSMSKIPSDDILESLYQLRKRESNQLKTVLELYDIEIHHKISKPDYQKLKTMVKRSIDQTLRLRNFWRQK